MCGSVLPKVGCSRGVGEDGGYGKEGEGAARAEKRRKILMDTTSAECTAGVIVLDSHELKTAQKLSLTYALILLPALILVVLQLAVRCCHVMVVAAVD